MKTTLIRSVSFLSLVLAIPFANGKDLSGIKLATSVLPAMSRGSLIAFWPADGTAMDLVGGHHGTLMNGAIYSGGEFKLAFDLDNTDGIYGGWGSSFFPPPAFDGGSFVSVPDSDAWAFGSHDFTISVWANFNAVPIYDIGHAQGGVFISNDEGPYEVNKWWFALGGGVLNFHINDPVNGPIFLVQAPFTPEPGQWYHFSISRHNSLFTIYVNGMAIGSEPSDRLIPDADAPLNIGEGEGFYFNGRLDNVGIYNRALAPGEIRNLANGRPRL